MSIVKAFAIAATVTSSALSGSPAFIVMAERGSEPEYTVVVSQNAPNWRAAREFTNYVARLTGVELPVKTDAEELPEKIVSIGFTRLAKRIGAKADLGREGFAISVKGPHLLIEGTEVGAYNGVLEVLEKFGGVGWYASDYEIVPEIERLAVPDNYEDVQRPAFDLREVRFADVTNRAFAAHLRLSPIGAGEAFTNRIETFKGDFKAPLAMSGHKESRLIAADIKRKHGRAEQFAIWDCAANQSHYLMPFPNMDAAAENLLFYREMGYSKIIYQGGDRCSDFAEAKVWMLAKMLWNPDLDVDELRDRFMKAYYGAAAPLVLKYWVELYAYPRSGAMVCTEEPQKTNLSDLFLEMSIRRFNEAEGLVAKEPELARHVRRLRLSPAYALLLRRYRRSKRDREFESIANKVLLEIFNSGKEEFGLLQLSEPPESGKGALVEIEMMEWDEE